MDLIDLASTLFGRQRTESTSVTPDATMRMVEASSAIDSTDGSAGVVMDCEITPADDTDGDESIIDVPTSPSVKAGDDVLVGLVGTGPLKTPVVIANPGFGDRIQTQMDTTEELVERAEAAARATSQHFWSDDNGAHVTQMTQDDWAESQTGPNALWNTLGLLFRDGLTNLLAVLTNGIAIYDGAGNAARNVVAAFSQNLIELGKGSASTIIRLCGGMGQIEYDSTYNGGSILISNPGGTNQNAELFCGDGSTYAHVGVQKGTAHMYGAQRVLFQSQNARFIDIANSVDKTYTMAHVLDVLDGSSQSEDGTFTQGTYCNAYNRASVWREGHMGGLSIVLQTTSSATSTQWLYVGTISIHPKAEVRALCGNETGAFSVINITTAGRITMLQSANGAMWSQINCVFPA